jgi:hypothetical protein
MRSTTHALNFLALAAFLLAANPARSGTITTYTDPNAWAAAASLTQNITFAGLAPTDGSTIYQGASGLTTGGVEFIGYTSSGNSWIEVVDTSFNSYYDFTSTDGSTDALLQEMDRPNASAPLPYIQIVLPTGVTAFSMDLFTVSPSALSYQVTVAGTNYTVATDPLPTEQFFGVTSDTPIATIDLTVLGTTYNGSTSALLSNFSFGTADLSQAPEAGTFLLIGSGLIGIAALKKRMRKPL